jgi:hypothetical protein
MNMDMEVAVLKVIRSAIQNGSILLSESEEGEIFQRLMARLLETRSGTDLLVLAQVFEQLDMPDMSRAVQRVYEVNRSKFSEVASPATCDKLASKLRQDVVYGLDRPEGSNQCLDDIADKLGRMLIQSRKKRGDISPDTSAYNPEADRSPLGQYFSARRSMSPKKSSLPPPSFSSPTLTPEEALRGYTVVASYRTPANLADWERDASADLDNLLE